MFSDEQNDSTRGQLAISSQNRNAACAFPMANWPKKRVLVFFFAGPLLALLALGFYRGASASEQAPTQNQTSSAPFQLVAGEHVSRSGDVMPATKTGTIYEQSSAENLGPSEVVPPRSVMAPTRSSFMANWENMSGATGYRLDVSTSPSFNSFVSGYENLDVGNITSRIVSGLSPGTTYYYRVRAYSVLGTGSNSEVMTATTLITVHSNVRYFYHGQLEVGSDPVGDQPSHREISIAVQRPNHCVHPLSVL